MSVAPLRIAMPCTGLGRQRRGFEAFTRALHRALRGTPGLQLDVYGGGGELLDDERGVWNLPRDSRAARAVGRLTGWAPYFVEQASFFAAFVPRLMTSAPDVVYFADVNLGNACWHWRRATGQRFRLLYYNGGATTRPYTRSDMVQQLTPEHRDAALARGERRDRMVVLPHGLDIAASLPARDSARVAATRRAFGAAEGRPLLLSVGMLDESVKRMRSLVDAVAALPEAAPHLVILGQETEETPALRDHARARLGERVFVGTWPRERMADAYEAADAFALFSPREGFGLAYVEALAHGLPCAVHDTTGTRYLFGDHGMLGDTQSAAGAADVLQRALAAPRDGAAAEARHAWAYAHFAWPVLAPRYVELLSACADGRLPGWSAA